MGYPCVAVLSPATVICITDVVLVGVVLFPLIFRGACARRCHLDAHYTMVFLVADTRSVLGDHLLLPFHVGWPGVAVRIPAAAIFICAVVPHGKQRQDFAPAPPLGAPLARIK